MRGEEVVEGTAGIVDRQTPKRRVASTEVALHDPSNRVVDGLPALDEIPERSGDLGNERRELLWRPGEQPELLTECCWGAAIAEANLDGNGAMSQFRQERSVVDNRCCIERVERRGEPRPVHRNHHVIGTERIEEVEEVVESIPEISANSRRRHSGQRFADLP